MQTKNTQQSRLNTRKGLWIAVLGLALVAGFTATTAEAAGHRMSVELNEPFEINGALYPAGTLTIREVRAYSPVETLNEVWVNNECLGLLLARDMADKTEFNRDELLFTRDSIRGHLVLDGLALRGERARGFAPIPNRATPDSGATMLASNIK